MVSVRKSHVQQQLIQIKYVQNVSKDCSLHPLCTAWRWESLGVRTGPPATTPQKQNGLSKFSSAAPSKGWKVLLRGFLASLHQPQRLLSPPVPPVLNLAPANASW